MVINRLITNRHKGNTQKTHKKHTYIHTYIHMYTHTHAQLASHTSDHAGEGKENTLQARVHVYVEVRVPTED